MDVFFSTAATLLSLMDFSQMERRRKVLLRKALVLSCLMVLFLAVHKIIHHPRSSRSTNTLVNLGVGRRGLRYSYSNLDEINLWTPIITHFRC